MLCMDSLVSLFSMEASGVVNAEAMVKGVVPIVLYFSSIIFFVGALWAKLGYLQDISAHSPTESPCSIALSHGSP